MPINADKNKKRDYKADVVCRKNWGGPLLVFFQLLNYQV